MAENMENAFFGWRWAKRKKSETKDFIGVFGFRKIRIFVSNQYQQYEYGFFKKSDLVLLSKEDCAKFFPHLVRLERYFLHQTDTIFNERLLIFSHKSLFSSSVAISLMLSTRHMLTLTVRWETAYCRQIRVRWKLLKIY